MVKPCRWTYTGEHAQGSLTPTRPTAAGLAVLNE
jgi:hypothetical protein